MEKYKIKFQKAVRFDFSIYANILQTGEFFQRFTVEDGK